MATEAELAALEAVTTEVRALFHRLGAVANEIHADRGVTAVMRAVLESLRERPRTVPSLARMRPVTRQHMQGVVNRLLAEGLTELVPNPEHRRSSLVRLTPAGRRTIDAMKREERRLLLAASLPLSESDLRRASSTLHILQDWLAGTAEWSALVHQRPHRSRPPR